MAPATYDVLVNAGSTANDLAATDSSGIWSDADTGTISTFPVHGTWGDNFG